MKDADDKGACLRHRLEYAAVRFVELGFRLAPYRLCLWKARALARFAFHVLRWRRKETLRRIRQVFPGISRRDADGIAYRSLRSLFLNAAEIMHLRGVSDGWIRAHVQNCDEAMAKVRETVKDGGAILALPHFGNWDLAGIIVAHYGIPIFSIAGVQSNPLTNAWMNERRAAGIAILPRGTIAIRGALRRLRAREVFAILPDVRMRTPDLKIRFLGAEANLGRGMALFARKTGAPVLLARVRRTAPDHHYLDVRDPIRPDPALDDEADIRRMTEAAMAAIEAEIRADPGQWFWYNRRWVLEPLPESAAGKRRRHDGNGDRRS